MNYLSDLLPPFLAVLGGVYLFVQIWEKVMTIREKMKTPKNKNETASEEIQNETMPAKQQSKPSRSTYRSGKLWLISEAVFILCLFILALMFMWSAVSEEYKTDKLLYLILAFTMLNMATSYQRDM